MIKKGFVVSFSFLLLLGWIAPQANAKVKDPADIYIEVFEDLTQQIEKQYQKLHKYCLKAMQRKYGDFNSRRWDKFYQKWEAKNIEIKTRAGKYQTFAPVLYEQTLLLLRSMQVVALEYRKFFYWEKSSFDDLKIYEDEYEASLLAIKEEIAFETEKRDIQLGNYQSE